MSCLEIFFDQDDASRSHIPTQRDERGHVEFLSHVFSISLFC